MPDEDKNSYYNIRNKIVDSVIYDDYGGKAIIYDLFIRSGKVYFISSFWSPIQPTFRLKIKDVKLTEFGMNQQEPVRYFYGSVADMKILNIYINGNSHSIKPIIIKPLIKKHNFAIATLFKYETANMVLRFITYYRSQGCTMFYLYFNGNKIPDDLPIGLDIMYRVWDFPYFLVDTEYIHCAQSAFLTTVKLRHLGDCKFLALIDMDEFIYSLDESVNIVDYLSTVSDDYTVFKIENYWAKCPDTGGPITYNSLGTGFVHRTKCIYRSNFKGHFAIHEPKKESGVNCKIYNCPALLLLHITMLHKERDELVKEPLLKTHLTLNTLIT